MSDPTARLSRSMLFVPASSMDMMTKATRSAADAVCLGLEDAVAPDQKDASRAGVIEVLRQLDFGPRLRMVRINALDTPFAYRDVIEIVEVAGDRLDLIMLPKTRNADDIRFLDTLLSQIELRMSLPHRIGIEAQIETPGGFLALREIAQSAARLEALLFGSADYAASMHMPLANVGETDAHDAAYPGHRWHAVMHSIVAAARANGLRCMDGPYASFKDEAGFETACRMALAMGFDGKQCIHPAQLAIANRVFAPTSEEVSRARTVVAAYEEVVQEGRGAVSLDGKMIDAANIRMAHSLLKRQKAIEDKEREAHP